MFSFNRIRWHLMLENDIFGCDVIRSITMRLSSQNQWNVHTKLLRYMGFLVSCALLQECYLRLTSNLNSMTAENMLASGTHSDAHNNSFPLPMRPTNYYCPLPVTLSDDKIHYCLFITKYHIKRTQMISINHRNGSSIRVSEMEIAAQILCVLKFTN